MSNPNFSKSIEWTHLVNTRLDAKKWAQDISTSLSSRVSSSLITGAVLKLKTYIAALDRYFGFTDDQKALMQELAVSETGVVDYDLDASATGLKRACVGLISLALSTIPTDENGYLLYFKLDSNGDQSLLQLETSDTANFKAGIDLLIESL